MEVEDRNNNERPYSKNQVNTNLPWVEKYRPTQLDNLISHEGILSTRKYHFT